MQSSFFSLLTVIGCSAAAIAGLAVWLVFQEPVTVVTMADAVASGEYGALLDTLAEEVGGLVRALARLL